MGTIKRLGKSGVLTVRSSGTIPYIQTPINPVLDEKGSRTETYVNSKSSGLLFQWDNFSAISIPICASTPVQSLEQYWSPPGRLLLPPPSSQTYPLIFPYIVPFATVMDRKIKLLLLRSKHFKTVTYLANVFRIIWRCEWHFEWFLNDHTTISRSEVDGKRKSSLLRLYTNARGGCWCWQIITWMRATRGSEQHYPVSLFRFAEGARRMTSCTRVACGQYGFSVQAAM